jgi:hypothetical protein
MTDTHCDCGKPLVFNGGTGKTLVGYYSPEGHNHDDNCRKRVYVCEDGHRTVIRRINKCQTVGCDWRGKETCFCHENGVTVEEWPDTPSAQTWEEAKARGVWM